MFLRKAKTDLNTCILNLQKSRSEIFIVGDRTEKLEAARLKRRLEEALIIARNLGANLERLIHLVPSREDVEQRQREKVEEVKESKQRWNMKWQIN